MLIPKWGCLQRREHPGISQKKFLATPATPCSRRGKIQAHPRQPGCSERQWVEALKAKLLSRKAVLILEWIGLRENLHWKLSFSRLTPKYMSCIFPSFNSWNYVDIENDMTMAKPNENLTTLKKRSWYFSLLHICLQIANERTNVSWDHLLRISPSAAPKKTCAIFGPKLGVCPCVFPSL